MPLDQDQLKDIIAKHQASRTSSRHSSSELPPADHQMFECVIKYVKMEEIIKDKRKELREIILEYKKQKDTYEKFILEHLSKNEKDFVSYNKTGGKLVKNISHTRGGYNKECLVKGIIQGLQELNLTKNIDFMVETIMNAIEENRPEREKITLKNKLR